MILPVAYKAAIISKPVINDPAPVAQTFFRIYNTQGFNSVPATPVKNTNAAINPIMQSSNKKSSDLVPAIGIGIALLK